MSCSSLRCLLRSAGCAQSAWHRGIVRSALGSGGTPVPPARAPPAALAAQPSLAPGGTRGGGSCSPPATLSPCACLPALFGEAPHARGGVPVVVGCSWGPIQWRWAGINPHFVSPASLCPPSLDLSELAKAAKKKLQAVSGGRAGLRGSHPLPILPDAVSHPAAAQQPSVRGAGHGRLR